MIDSRSQGLLRILAFVVLLFLPLSFVTWAILGVEVTNRVVHQLINYPLYLAGTVFAGLVYFGFYQSLKASLGQLNIRQSVHLTGMQSAVLAFVLFSIVFATKDKAISRVFLGSYILFAAGCLFFINLFLPVALARLVFRERSLRACLLIGRADSTGRVQKWIAENSHLGLEVVDSLQLDSLANESSTDCLFADKKRQLQDIIRCKKVNQVILVDIDGGKEWVHAVYEVCEREGCRLLVYNHWQVYFEQPLVSVSGGKYAFFALQEEPLENPMNRFWKRMLDYTVALLVVCTVLPVLLVLVWCFQRIQSPGPVFYKQTRSGFNRKTFKLYKFRTMNLEPNPSEACQASLGDERVFGFGKFLRKTSLDEIPQFLNVLLGDMSVVGPRPHLIEHDDLFSSQVMVYRQRHFVLPGITGLAQVKGFRGEITDLDVLKKRIDCDLQYINEWSLAEDLEIIIRTAIQVCFPLKEAY